MYYISYYHLLVLLGDRASTSYLLQPVFVENNLYRPYCTGFSQFNLSFYVRYFSTKLELSKIYFDHDFQEYKYEFLISHKEFHMLVFQYYHYQLCLSHVCPCPKQALRLLHCDNPQDRTLESHQE